MAFQFPQPGDTLTAVFRVVADAKQFADRVQEPGWSNVTVVKRSGKTVTWVVGPDADGKQHFLDLLETVGYYGSSDRFAARLNGVRAPRSF